MALSQSTQPQQSLKGIGIFAGFPADALDRIQRRCVWRRYAPGEPIVSYLGQEDPAGHVLQATILALADELASAAEPVMGKLDRVPVAIVRGLAWPPGEGSSRALMRDPARDLFR